MTENLENQTKMEINFRERETRFVYRIKNLNSLKVHFYTDIKKMDFFNLFSVKMFYNIKKYIHEQIK